MHNKLILVFFFFFQPHLRKAGEEALDMWHSKIGFLPFLDNEILSTAMKETNPNLRSTVCYVKFIIPFISLLLFQNSLFSYVKLIQISCLSCDGNLE